MARRSADRRRKPPPPTKQPTLTAMQRTGELSPLDYLLSVIRDSAADPRRRDRAAVAAAPFCHARLAEKTRKAVEAEAAREAGGDEWADDLDVDAQPRQ